MAGARRWILERVDWSSVTKHATSFCKALFNANYRSIKVFKKQDIANKRKNMEYAAIQPLAHELREFAMEERAFHAALFEKKSESLGTLVSYDHDAWMTTFRRMFTTATIDAYNKQYWVMFYINIHQNISF